MSLVTVTLQQKECPVDSRKIIACETLLIKTPFPRYFILIDKPEIGRNGLDLPEIRVSSNSVAAVRITPTRLKYTSLFQVDLIGNGSKPGWAKPFVRSYMQKSTLSTVTVSSGGIRDAFGVEVEQIFYGRSAVNIELNRHLELL